MLRNVLSTLAMHFKGSDIIYRSTSWGHLSCGAIKEPFQSEAEALKSIEANPFR